MYSRRKQACAIIAIFTILSITLASIPPAKAQFVIAYWDYPDEFGQGLHGVSIYENSTGSWVYVTSTWHDSESQLFEWNVSVGIKLKTYSYLNSTLVGAGSIEEGKNYLRHNVTVVNRLGYEVFSQNNFTYTGDDDIYDPIWIYFHEVVLDFLPEFGNLYTVTIFYEVWW